MLQKFREEPQLSLLSHASCSGSDVEMRAVSKCRQYMNETVGGGDSRNFAINGIHLFVHVANQKELLLVGA